jgi:hypothetical protein
MRHHQVRSGLHNKVRGQILIMGRRGKPSGMGMRSWKEVLCCCVDARFGAVFPFRASPVRLPMRVDRRTATHFHESRVGPYWVGYPSRADHGCATHVAIKSYLGLDKVMGISNTSPETTSII